MIVKKHLLPGNKSEPTSEICLTTFICHIRSSWIFVSIGILLPITAKETAGLQSIIQCTSSILNAAPMNWYSMKASHGFHRALLPYRVWPIPSSDIRSRSSQYTNNLRWPKPMDRHGGRKRKPTRSKASSSVTVTQKILIYAKYLRSNVHL